MAFCCGSIPRAEVGLRLTGCDHHGNVTGSVTLLRRDTEVHGVWALFKLANHESAFKMGELLDWISQWSAWSTRHVEWTEPPAPDWLTWTDLELEQFDTLAHETPWDQLGLF